MPDSKAFTTPIYLRHLTWLALNDEDFMRVFAGNLALASITDVHLAWLLQHASDYFVTYGQLMPVEAIELELVAMPEAKGFEKKLVVQCVEEAILTSGGFRDFLFDLHEELVCKASDDSTRDGRFIAS